MTVPQAGVRSKRAHTGTSTFMYSGLAKGGTSTHSYLKVYDESANPVPVGTTKTLSYWIFRRAKRPPRSCPAPRRSARASRRPDLTDGSTLRDSGAVDQNGNRAHPLYQCGHLTLDTWNHVTVNLATNKANKQIARILVGFDHAGATGGYRGYIHDLAMSSMSRTKSLLSARWRASSGSTITTPTMPTPPAPRRARTMPPVSRPRRLRMLR